jgi:hypothetical protein
MGCSPHKRTEAISDECRQRRQRVKTRIGWKPKFVEQNSDALRHTNQHEQKQRVGVKRLFDYKRYFAPARPLIPSAKVLGCFKT